jgi:hypothetical protein
VAGKHGWRAWLKNMAGKHGWEAWLGSMAGNVRTSSAHALITCCTPEESDRYQSRFGGVSVASVGRPYKGRKFWVTHVFFLIFFVSFVLDL